MRAPPLFHLYVAATVLLAPFVAWFEIRKLRRQGLSALRAHEKMGHASQPRIGSGNLIWFHAASVGESLSVLALITRMGEMLPRAHFLITSGTPTSAKLVADRMPPRTVHQFAPLDAGGPLTRFLHHWRPAAAIFVESELWPRMLRMTRARGTMMALVNARLSAKSRAAWARRPGFAAYVLDVFDLILTQNDDMAQAMVDMHAPADRVARGSNLKSMSAPLPQNPALLAQIRTAIKARPIWVAASTHKGEETTVLDAHKTLLQTIPDLLLILVPRHPDRSDEVAKLIAKHDLTYALRSDGALPRDDHAVYLADTLGELGNWYALSDVVFLGGSLLPIGGHNPFEVVQSEAAVLSGPHVTNFAETINKMVETGAAEIVADVEALTFSVGHLLQDGAHKAASLRAARAFVQGKSDELTRIAARLIHILKLEDDNR
ncbi:3-deoxy-D-manno-octulosonic acid transferase [Roseobacter fucihabitans]|uniref:3-deoxy-D-manno-octulosonic acid transferase n=1 Tax=Roseobacter fucihabitans TaxID=1537242 RepID=A0ABZ2BTD0_9RHOB|nr:3-deoxy-D-manno-octulosonic acid transferase [Roseobacter litoralis]MBC6964280.1 3-deoxy-D-manno-octulosonic acid transferase [Roseobacter litoralis]